MSSLPSGTVTFLFTDIEGSTRLLQQLGDGYGELVQQHRSVLREALGAAGGREIDTQGDAFFFSFTRARDAIAGAVAAQRALAEHEWPAGAEVKVRMGLHTGEPSVGEEGYHGIDVVRAARICSAAAGGQILLSETTRGLAGSSVPDGVRVKDLGPHDLKDIGSERLSQLVYDEREATAPALRPERGRARRGTSRAEQLAETWEARLERQIDEFVEGRLEAAVTSTVPRDLAGPLSGLVFVAALAVVLFAIAVVAIVLLVRLAV